MSTIEDLGWPKDLILGGRELDRPSLSLSASYLQVEQYQELAEFLGFSSEDFCLPYDHRPEVRVKLAQREDFRKATRAYGMYLAQEAGAPTPEALVFLTGTLFEYYESHNLHINGAQDPQFDHLLEAIGEWHLIYSGGRSTVRRVLAFPDQRPELGSAVALNCTTKESVRDGLKAIFREGKVLKDRLLKEQGRDAGEYAVYAYLQQHQDPQHYSYAEVAQIEAGEYRGEVPKGCYFAVKEVLPDRLAGTIVAGAGQTRSFKETGDTYTFEISLDDDNFVQTGIKRERGHQEFMLVATDRANDHRKLYPYGEEPLPIPAFIRERGPLSAQEVVEIAVMTKRIFMQVQNHEPPDSPFRQGFRGECQWGVFPDGRIGPKCTELTTYHVAETGGRSFEGKRKVVQINGMDDLGKLRQRFNEWGEVFVYIPPELTQDEPLRLAVLAIIRQYGEIDPKNLDRLILLYGAKHGTGHGVVDLIDAAENWKLHYYLVEDRMLKDNWLIRLATRRGAIESLSRLVDEERGIWLREIAALDPHEAGRKARTLVTFFEQYEGVLPIEFLDGFLIPRKVIAELYRANNLKDPERKIREFWKEAKGDVTRFVKRMEDYSRSYVDKHLRNVPDEIFREWVDILRDLGIVDMLLATRSAMGCEDGLDAWAGSFESFIRVFGEEALKQSILEVAKSFWGVKARAHLLAHYRADQIDELLGEFWMSVIVQRFMDIPALGGVNFVMQTRARTQPGFMEVVFTGGDCEEVVGLRGGKPVFIERATGRAFVKVNGVDGGDRFEPYPGELPFNPELLHDLGLKVEDHLQGRTGDIEGGYYIRGDWKEVLPLYQLRPVAGNSG